MLVAETGSCVPLISHSKDVFETISSNSTCTNAIYFIRRSFKPWCREWWRRRRSRRRVQSYRGLARGHPEAHREVWGHSGRYVAARNSWSGQLFYQDRVLSKQIWSWRLPEWSPYASHFKGRMLNSPEKIRRGWKVSGSNTYCNLQYWIINHHRKKACSSGPNVIKLFPSVI